MIRSCRIPPILLRICGEGIHTALLVTTEGELLGSSRAAAPSTAAAAGSPSVTTAINGHTSSSHNTTTTDAADAAAGSDHWIMMDDHDIGTLVTDIAMDYHRLGHEYVGLVEEQSSPRTGAAAAAATASTKSQLSCLILEMTKGIVGVSSCAGCDCLVILLADVDTPLGLIKARCQALSSHVQQALSTLVNEAT